MTKRILCCLGLLFFTLVYSCGLSGPKPDKRIIATLELVGEDLSEKEIKEAVLAIKNRFDKFGAYPEINRVPNTKKLNFSLETAADQERIFKFLTIEANLQFFHVVRTEKMLNFAIAADEWIAGGETSDEDVLIGEPDEAGDLEENRPLLEKLQSAVSGGMFSILEADTAMVMGYLRRNDVLNLLEENKRNTKFAWGLKSKSNEAFPLYALRTLVSQAAPLNGSMVERAYQNYGAADMPTVTIQMNEEGADIWAEMTEHAFKNSSQIAIVIDDIVHSAPGVNNGRIVGGRSEISGDFTLEEAVDLASMIGAGAIPKTRILSFDVVSLK